ncbi:MAG: hypothetical protein WCI04_06455 [archaeon]
MKFRVPMPRKKTPAERDAALLRKGPPSLWKRAKVGAAVGAVGLGIAMSQGPAFNNNFNATKSSMHVGAEAALKSEMPLSQRFKVGVGLERAPKIHVGEGWSTHRDAKGDLYIGRVTVASQSLKTFRPSVQLTPGGLLTTGKGAVAGALVGAGLGVASGVRKKKRYNAVVNRATAGANRRT